MFTNNHNQLFTPLWQNGPCPASYYEFPNKIASSEYDEISTLGRYGTQRASKPITVGTSVVGLKFSGGVLIAADNLVSYGSTAKYTDIDRVFAINNKVILGAGGDYADFQYLKRNIDQKVTEDICFDDNIELKPKSLYNWLTRVFYYRRSRFDPLWLDIIVGGLEDGVPFLGHIDLRGKSYQSEVVATGFGRHLAIPLLRAETEGKENLSQSDAEKLIHKSMEVLFYRDARAYPSYNLAICTAEGTSVKGPLYVEENWEFANMTKGE